MSYNHFERIDHLLQKQKEILKELKSNTQAILDVIVDFYSEKHNKEKTHPLIYSIEQIQLSQERLKNDLLTFSCPSFNDVGDNTIELNFQSFSGEITSFPVSLSSSISSSYYDFFKYTGHNPMMIYVYPVTFFIKYEDEFVPFNLNNNKLSWFETFGTRVPVIHFFIGGPTEEKKKNIASQIRIYLPYHRLTTDFDDETLYSHYREWVLHSNNNTGESLFVRYNKHLFTSSQ
jgi:hypothetical protein